MDFEAFNHFLKKIYFAVEGSVEIFQKLFLLQ